jgi:MFS family permease
VDRTALTPGSGRALTLLACALVLAMTTWFSASAVIPQLRDEWSLSTSAGAWLTIAVQLGFVCGALLSSALTLADVLPPHRVLFAGAAGAAGANALLLLSGGPASAIPLRFATGFFLAGVYPPGLKLMATWFRRGRGTALGIVVGALTLGSAVPFLVNGLGGVDWHPVIAITSVLTLAGGTLALVAVPEGPYPFPRASFDPRQAGLVFTNRGVRLASLGYFGHMWELYAMWAWFFVFARDELFADAGTAALVAFAVIATGALGCVAGGIAGDRYGRPETNAIMLACSALCAIAIGLLPAAAALAVGLVWGFTVVADSAQYSTMVTEHADQAYVGTALALQLAVGFTLTVVTIWLVPFLVDGVGWRWAFSFLALGPVLGIVAMLRLRSYDRVADRGTAATVSR